MTDAPIKILIVDDEEGIVDFMHKILDFKGYQTFTAMSGPEAVVIYEKERPDICILDVQLGYSPLDGIELLERIKAINKDAECVMVTRITEMEKMDQSSKLGVQHYLLKPVETKTLLSLIKNIADTIKAKRVSRG